MRIVCPLVALRFKRGVRFDSDVSTSAFLIKYSGDNGEPAEKDFRECGLPSFDFDRLKEGILSKVDPTGVTGRCKSTLSSMVIVGN